MAEELREIADSENDLELILFANSSELLAEVVIQLNEIIETGLRTNGVFHLALTGGTLGTRLSNTLVQHWNSHPGEFSGLHIWWSDERFVEAGSSERNCSPVMQALINSDIHVHAVGSRDDVVSVDDAVREYRASLGETRMDITILGLGPDGHVASLFPGALHAESCEKVIAITDSPKPPAIRATFTLSMINASKLIWLVASGASKANAVTKIIERDPSTPASFVRAVGHTRLIVDADALATGQFDKTTT